ncbi:MAG: dihydropteroate synthase [Holosporales bacterium]|jgi:2-amino-4-hydroxy-6-hydroxymethyldihydropteridine diphosphokinase/dihydropteroate synthase|nr:dihydropteroate synthase [Holosporales bacterium]
MNSVVFIGLGANLGDRMETFRSAISEISEHCLSNIKKSVVIETPAVLLPNSPKSWDRPFLNMVIKGETSSSPQQLLDHLKKIEIELGRPEVHEKWSPRTIDLDILLWDGQILETSKLTIPHKELLNRPFLLHLIALLDSEVVYPEGAKIKDLARRSVDFSSLLTGSFVLFPKLVGVVNITPDSFSDGGEHFETKEAINHAISLVKQGASVIELGPQSLRVGAELLNEEQEWSRLEPVLSGIEDFQKWEEYKITVSIETLSPAIVHKVIKRGAPWINDVANAWDKSTLKAIAESGAKIVSMHSLDVPPKKINIIEGDVVEKINAWSAETCKNLCKNGFSKNKIIVDPGLGFGKNCYQNIELLRNAASLKRIGCEVMVGHSRKSYFNAVTRVPSSERDIETIAVSSKLAEQSVDYLRVHNVHDHQRFFVAQTLASL